jgi:hypothetical protein
MRLNVKPPAPVALSGMDAQHFGVEQASFDGPDLPRPLKRPLGDAGGWCLGEMAFLSQCSVALSTTARISVLVCRDTSLACFVKMSCAFSTVQSGT